MKPKLRWEFKIPNHGTMAREAHTLSEARALCKAALNLERLPVGTKTRRLYPANVDAKTKRFVDAAK